MKINSDNNSSINTNIATQVESPTAEVSFREEQSVNIYY